VEINLVPVFRNGFTRQDVSKKLDDGKNYRGYAPIAARLCDKKSIEK